MVSPATGSGTAEIVAPKVTEPAPQPAPQPVATEPAPAPAPEPAPQPQATTTTGSKAEDILAMIRARQQK